MHIIDILWNIKWIRGTIKYILRFITRKSELHRICIANSYSSHSVKLVNNCIQSMKHSKYNQLCQALFCCDIDSIGEHIDTIFFLKMYSTTVSEIFHQSIIEKNVIFYNNLSYVIKHIYEYNTLKQVIHLKRTTSFDRNNSNHMDKLKSIWSCLKPNEEFPIGKSEKWKEIGFQGMLPETDFRGLGILALEAIAFLSSSSSNSSATMLGHDLNVKCLFEESLETPYGYPFTIGIINLLQSQVDLLDDGFLRHIIFVNLTENQSYESLKNSNLQNFWRFFYTFFSEFHRFWMSNKQQNILNFNTMKKIYTDNVIKNIPK